MNMYINHMCTYTYERIAMRPFRQTGTLKIPNPGDAQWLDSLDLQNLFEPTDKLGKKKTLADIKYNYCILGQPCVNALLKHFCLFEPVWAKRFSMLNFIDTIYIHIGCKPDWLGGMPEMSEYTPEEKKTHIMSEYAPDILLDDMSETMAK